MKGVCTMYDTNGIEFIKKYMSYVTLSRQIMCSAQNDSF